MMSESHSSYRQILKTSSIVGGASVVSIAIGLVRTKVLAVLLGPAGTALFGLYASTLSLLSVIFDVGISHSGVRQIAESAAKGDAALLAKTTYALRKIVLFSGVLAVIVLLLLRGWLSRMTFGDDSHAGALAVLSLFLFFGMVTGGQSAVIQGTRRIRDMGRIRIFGALFGVIVSVPIIWFMRNEGVPWAMVATAFVTLVISWWFARQIGIEQVTIKWLDIRNEIKGLVGLGVVFMSSALMGTAVLYLTQVMVVRSFGLNAAGLYQASTALSMLYVGMVLDAMGMDFYPRLTGVANDNNACNQMVNEQGKISLLIAVPGVLATLTLAPLILGIFYSGKFVPAVEILRWQILGVMGRVITWPIGYIMLAKGARRLFFWTELASSLLHVACIYLGIRIWGLAGAGIAFFVLYVTYFFIVVRVARYLTGFSLSRENKEIGLRVFPVIAIVFVATWKFANIPSLIISMLITLLVSVWSLRQIYLLIGSPPISEFIVRFRDAIKSTSRSG